MGFTPAQVNEMTFWEFGSATDGYEIGNGISSPDSKYPTDEQFEKALINVRTLH